MQEGGRTPSWRAFGAACAAGAVVALPVLVWVVTQGTWNLFQRTFFGDFYDAQARALFHGHWYVPPGVVQVEGFVVKGHTYMYFGPFPALLRMPVLLVTSRLDGRLTQLSLLLAVSVAIVGACRLGWKVRCLVTRSPVSRREKVLVACAVFVLATGSVFVFLASQAVVYNEDEAWGAALAVLAFDAMVGFVMRPSTRRLVVCAVLVALDLLTRGSVGLGPLAGLALLALLHATLWLQRRMGGARSAHPGGRATGSDDRVPGSGDGRWAWLGVGGATGTTRAGALGAAVVLALGVYAAVNEMKFGSLFAVPFRSQVYAAHDPALRAALAANGGSLLGLQFVPTALVQYLRPDALRLVRPFPFVAFPPPATDIGHVRYASRAMASSVTATMPLFGVLAAVGVWVTFRPRRAAGRRRAPGQVRPPWAVLRVPVAGAAAGVVSAVAYAYIVQRYLADWMPLLVVAGVTGLAAVVRWARVGAPWRRRAAVAVGAVLGIASVGANLALSVANFGELTPSNPVSTRTAFVRMQVAVDRALYGDPPPNVHVRAHLPRPAPAGTLVVLGRCAALYQSDGTTWTALEQSEAGGHVRLTVTFPALAGAAHVRWPLVVTGDRGAGDYLAVRPVGRDTVAFSYLFQKRGARWFEGRPVRIVPGRRYVMDVVLDANTGNESVSLDGTQVFAEPWFARQPKRVTVGVDSIGTVTVARFPGTVHRLPTPTPLCDEVRRAATGEA